MKEYAFGIDLGGTTAKVGLFTTSGALLEKWEVPTDTSNAGEHILENLADAIHAKMAEKEITSEQVEGVGIGVPGPVLDSRVVPIICANLGGWGERNVSAQLSGLLDGMKVLVGNDANVAALGEIWMGTAKGCRSAVMVTLGTGVGGGIIIDDKVYSGFNYAGAELGHIVIVTDGEPCGCGRHGCWEAYSSATALIRMTARALDAARADGRQTLMEDMVAKAGKVSGRTAFDAMRAGDAVATEVVNTYLHYLAQGLSNIINIFQPEVLSIGGGISNEGLLETLVPLIRAEVYGHGVVPDTRICIAELKNNAGIIGGAVLGVR